MNVLYTFWGRASIRVFISICSNSSLMKSFIVTSLWRLCRKKSKPLIWVNWGMFLLFQPFNTLCPLKCYTYLNLQLSAARLLKHVRPLSGHQTLRLTLLINKLPQCYAFLMLSVLFLGTRNGKKLVLRTILRKLLITQFYLFYLVS